MQSAPGAPTGSDAARTPLKYTATLAVYLILTSFVAVTSRTPTVAAGREVGHDAAWARTTNRAPGTGHRAGTNVDGFARLPSSDAVPTTLICVLLWSAVVTAVPAANQSAAVAPAPTWPSSTRASRTRRRVWYERASDGAYRVYLLYDHERDSPNRAAGHIHFRLVGTPARAHAGVRESGQRVERPAGFGRGRAEDRRHLAGWPDLDDRPDRRTCPATASGVTVTMPGETLYVARMQPYRLSDLDRLLARVACHRSSSHADRQDGRRDEPLEIIRHRQRAGAAYRVFVRARAHPWEAGQQLGRRRA